MLVNFRKCFLNNLPCPFLLPVAHRLFKLAPVDSQRIDFKKLSFAWSLCQIRCMAFFFCNLFLCYVETYDTAESLLSSIFENNFMSYILLYFQNIKHFALAFIVPNLYPKVKLCKILKKRKILIKVSSSFFVFCYSLLKGCQWPVLLFLKHNQRHSVVDTVKRTVIVVENVRRRIENVVITRTANKPVAAILPENHTIPVGSICIIADSFPAFAIEKPLSPFKRLLNPVSHLTIQVISIRIKLCNSF